MMFLQVIILLAGFLFLVKGADWFVEGAASIAKKLGIPQLIIGLTIVAMGTSMPEAAVSITAAINKNAGITIGNVVGSNILNIFIILGITAVITNVAIQKSTLLYEIPFMTVITIILLIFGITGSEVTFIEGVIFWILFLIYLGYLFVMAKKGNDQEEAEAKDNPVWKCMLLMVIGGILVVKGSDFAVSGATEIARYFGMSERFIGLTIVALGTSLPELVTSVTATQRTPEEPAFQMSDLPLPDVSSAFLPDRYRPALPLPLCRKMLLHTFPQRDLLTDCSRQLQTCPQAATAR